MARYNTVTGASTTSGAATFNSPAQGVLTTLTGTAPYTVNLANPVLFTGESQSFYNNSTGTVTLATPSGNILGPGFTTATSQTIPQYGAYTLTSDGTNYVVTNNEGGPQRATTLNVASTATFTSTISASPANASITLSPTGTGTVTINPATAGSMDNVNIGATTAGTMRCSNITVTGTTSFSNGINGTAIGNSSASTGAFTTLSSSSTTTLAGATFSAGVQVNSTLGCNSQVTFNGNIASSGTGSGTIVVTGGLGVSGQVTCNTLSAVTITETSSIALKENIVPIENALDTILQLFGVIYDRKDGSSKDEAGLIAEDVYKVAPSLVQLDKNGKPYGVKYTKLGVYLLEAVKTLSDEIKTLKGK